MQTQFKTLQIQEPGAHRAHGLAFLRLGFRPFYLGAALFSMVAVPVWVLAWLGWLQWTPAIAPMWWHAHEMLFGFVGAVVIGFLMTAGKAWTGLPTPRGPALGALALVWLAARVALWWVPYGVYAALDFVLLPTVALILLRLLLRAGNRRNLPIAGLLGLMALANGFFHASVLGWVNLSPQVSLHAMLGLVVLLESVMAGRVIPGFTMSAIGGISIKPLDWLERGVMVSTALGLALWVFAPSDISPL
ncbi:MAG: NnrS family protein, partial [Comamonadaceae bacterium]